MLRWNLLHCDMFAKNWQALILCAKFIAKRFMMSEREQKKVSFVTYSNKMNGFSLDFHLVLYHITGYQYSNFIFFHFEWNNALPIGAKKNSNFFNIISIIFLE
jgi:hypothetical protein